MTQQKRYNRKVQDLLANLKKSKTGTIVHRKIIYTEQEVDSAKTILNRLQSNEVIRVKPKVKIITENGDG